MIGGQTSPVVDLFFPTNSIMLSISWTYLLYYVPLIAAISLVFGATRHEDMSLILKHAFHTARWITGFLAIMFVAMLVMDWMV